MIKVNLERIGFGDIASRAAANADIKHDSEIEISTRLSFTVINAMFHPKVSHYIKDGFLYIEFPKDKLQLHLHGQQENGFNLVYTLRSKKVGNVSTTSTWIDIIFRRWDKDFIPDDKTMWVDGIVLLGKRGNR